MLLFPKRFAAEGANRSKLDPRSRKHRAHRRRRGRKPRRIREATAFSARCTRIATLLQHFLETGEDTAFLAHVQRSEDPHRVVAAINEEIDLAPGDLTRGARPQKGHQRAADGKLGRPPLKSQAAKDIARWLGVGAGHLVPCMNVCISSSVSLPSLLLSIA